MASLTKSMVATVTLQLVQERKITLDEPISERLPGLVTGDDRITVRQLLNHTSGLAEYVAADEFADPGAVRPPDLHSAAARGRGRTAARTPPATTCPAAPTQPSRVRCGRSPG